MASRPYFVNEPEGNDGDFYQQQDVFSNQQVPFDMFDFPEGVAYPPFNSTDGMTDQPFLFSDVPYSADFSVTASPNSQQVPGMAYPQAQPGYSQFNSTSSSGPWLEPVPALSPYSQADAIPTSTFTNWNAPQTPFESSPLEESPMTARSAESDGFQMRSMTFSPQESSSRTFSKPPAKRKPSHNTLYSDREAQATTNTSRDGDFRSPGRSRTSSKSSSKTSSKTPSKAPPMLKSTEPPTIEVPKSKKLRGLPSSLITVFDANTKPHVKRNTRKSYSDEARKKVEDVRKIGACSQCRYRKRTVSFPVAL